MRFNMGNPDRKHLCNVCGELHTKEELQKCRDNYNAIQKHNNDRRGKGLKFKDELWQFTGHVFRKNARDNNYLAYHSPKYDKIFIDLLKFVKKDGSVDIEGIVTTCVHEFNHFWLDTEINWVASKMWDYCGIREMYDKEGYLGFVQDYGDDYYDALCKKTVETEKWLKKHRDKI